MPCFLHDHTLGTSTWQDWIRWCLALHHCLHGSPEVRNLLHHLQLRKSPAWPRALHFALLFRCVDFEWKEWAALENTLLELSGESVSAPSLILLDSRLLGGSVPKVPPLPPPARLSVVRSAPATQTTYDHKTSALIDGTDHGLRCGCWGPSPPHFLGTFCGTGGGHGLRHVVAPRCIRGAGIDKGALLRTQPTFVCVLLSAAKRGQLLLFLVLRPSFVLCAGFLLVFSPGRSLNSELFADSPSAWSMFRPFLARGRSWRRPWDRSVLPGVQTTAGQETPAPTGRQSRCSASEASG